MLSGCSSDMAELEYYNEVLILHSFCAGRAEQGCRVAAGTAGGGVGSTRRKRSNLW